MLVAAPPQFHYTLFCPPSAKILKETLLEVILSTKHAEQAMKFSVGSDLHLN